MATGHFGRVWRSTLKRTLDKLVAELIATGNYASTTDPASPRGRIARAALELFAERSYETTTTKAIADRARTTERTLFKHFQSKDRLFALTVFPAFLKSLMPLVEPVETLVQTSTSDFRTTLRAVLVNRISFAVAHPVLATMVWRELLARPAFRSAFKKVFVRRAKPIVDAFISKAKESGELRDLPTDVIARTIQGHLVGYLVMRLVIAPERRWDTEADADQMLELIMRGIGSER